MNLRSRTLRNEREKVPEELVWTCVQDFHQHTALSLLGTCYWKAEIPGDQLEKQGTVERYSGKSLPECGRGLGRAVPAAQWTHWYVHNGRSSFTTLFLACWRYPGVCDPICNEALWENGSEEASFFPSLTLRRSRTTKGASSHMASSPILSNNLVISLVSTE